MKGIYNNFLTVHVSRGNNLVWFTGNILRGVFMHLCMEIPRHTGKNPIAAGDFKRIFARNCEGTEQLPF